MKSFLFINFDSAYVVYFKFWEISYAPYNFIVYIIIHMFTFLFNFLFFLTVLLRLSNLVCILDYAELDKE